MRLSVIIPAQNEEGSLAGTVEGVSQALGAEGIEYEVLIVDDGSTDGTASLIARLAERDPCVHGIASPYRNGFGFAVRAGLEQFTGDAVAIVMADGSDDPKDLVAYYRLLIAGYDCALGSRFMAGGKVSGYPLPKLILNRLVNRGIRTIFGHGYDDTTNT